MTARALGHRWGEFNMDIHKLVKKKYIVSSDENHIQANYAHILHGFHMYVFEINAEGKLIKLIFCPT